MRTENPLAEISANQVAIAGDDAFDAIKSSQAYLPRLQLMTANSEKCKSGEFPTNHYARVYDSDQQDLGADVDILVCSWRPMALETTDEGAVIICYDPKVVDGKPTGEFARIMAEADKPGMNGCMYGPQFLVWVPATQEFMTFYMASKTARRASSAVKAQMGKAATLGSQKIETKDYTWFGPTCCACSTEFEMPTSEQAAEEMNKFQNPPEPEVESAEGADDSRE